jgi:hypothetical protein
MPKRRSVVDDEDDWREAPNHAGEMAMGCIADLRHTEPRGKPFTRRYGPLGFDITPGQTKRKKRR